MGVINAIKSKLNPVERLEAELARLNETGASLVEEINRSAAQESELEDVEQLAKAMVATRAAQNRLRKTDARILDVRSQLDVARSEARKKLLAGLQKEHVAVARIFLERAREVSAATKRVIEAREALSAAGFRQEFELLPIHPGLPGMIAVGSDLLDAYEIAIGLAAAPVAAVPKPLTPPGPPIDRSGAQGPARLDSATSKPPRVRAARRETAQKGEVLFYQFRGLIEHSRKGAIQAGDCVALTPEEATPLLKSGSGDIVTPETVAAIDAPLGAAASTHLKEVAE